MPSLQLPGNPRYQPQNLVKIFGYDNLMQTAVDVEIATLETLGDLNLIPQADILLLTPEVCKSLLGVTTSEVDYIERNITKHDVRALVHMIKEKIPESLQRFVHIPLTSYDVLDTARIIQFRRAHTEVILPLVNKLIDEFRHQSFRCAKVVQIGRTHGQHALPITVGFWFATILGRFLKNAERINRNAGELVGKISGAVGAHNAQIGLGICSSGEEFEQRVLSKFGLQSAPISTQILPPEPLADYLFSIALFSASIAQFARDARHLMRTEIGELHEPFVRGQVGSSTMAHKRNPINFENLEGTWIKNKNEFGKVLDTLISEHQRDLVGSCVSRDYPTILVNFVQQLNTLLSLNKEGIPFIRRIAIDEDRCLTNLHIEGSAVLAEPLYLALQLAGFKGDAHKLVNEEIIPAKKRKNLISLVQVVEEHLIGNLFLTEAWEKIPRATKEMLDKPEQYIGEAVKKTYSICSLAEMYLKKYAV